MPIIAVMVALSSLLVIIFIIIILYMLRSVTVMQHRAVRLYSKINLYVSLLAGLKNTNRQEAIQTPSG